MTENEERLIWAVVKREVARKKLEEELKDYVAPLEKAAPDMYKALLSALGSLVALDIKSHSWGTEILDKIQEALVKAKGIDIPTRM